jgi:gamma-glutamyltranspeptidase/glutathione hydrolase
MAPPSSGGICLAQIFEMIAPYDLAKMGHNSTKSIQVIVKNEELMQTEITFRRP